MSETITLWGRATSANVQKAVWALEELGVSYERIDVGGKYGGLNTPDFIAMNPNQLIPVIRDEDLVLWESHAVVRYLAATYGSGGLWPEDAKERAIVDQWTDWTATTFQPAWIDVFWRLVRTPPSQRDHEAIAEAVGRTVGALRMIEATLSDKPFLAGSVLTYADIVAGTALYRWFTMEIDRPELPNVAAWYERLRNRDAYVKGVCVSYDELFARET